VPDLQDHLKDVADAVVDGKLVPFLGAGLNLCDRPPGTVFSPNQSEFLPNGAELARFFADTFRYPELSACSVRPCGFTPPPPDLSKVTQYGVTRRGPGDLYSRLTDIFGREYPVTRAHRFLVRLCRPAPKALKDEDRYPLIVTTNYDNLMERALEGREFDLVYYDSADDQRGQFFHKPPGGQVTPIPRERANEYTYPFLEDRPTILKMHGTVDAAADQTKGVVITEDDYIDYLASEALDKLLPPRLLGKLRRNHLLFLGYGLRDWNLRVFLRRIKRAAAQNYVSWAVVKDAPEEERLNLRDTARVDVRLCDLIEYLRSLASELESRRVHPEGWFDGWE
jgi:hypothetical protein